MIINCPKCNVEFDNYSKWGVKKFCSRKCSNSRNFSAETNELKRIKSKEWHANNVSPCKGKPGWKPTEEQKKQKSETIKQLWIDRGHVPKTREECLAKNKATVMRYRARKLKATPEHANTKLINEIYRHCPKGYEVDHIIALAEGGLHHEDNLQYLPALVNRKKNRTQNYDRSKIIKWQDILKGTICQNYQTHFERH
jgi:hypothetical protein